MQHDFTTEDACIWLCSHNKGVSFTRGNHGNLKIFTKISPDNWSLPCGWYYKHDVGFTNRYRTTPEKYDYVPVEFVKPTLLDWLFGIR